MDTKTRILDCSLELFARKGFHATSVRDIAARVGIKDSSLYFHYKNKQAILEALTVKYIKLSNEMMDFLNLSVNNLSKMNDDLFTSITRTYISSYFMDNFIRKYISVMNHEQSHDTYIRKQYIIWCIDKPIEFQCKLFIKLQDIKYLKNGDPKQMALAYYSPIYLLFDKYIYDESIDGNINSFIEEALETTEAFLRVYKENKV